MENIMNSISSTTVKSRVFIKNRFSGDILTSISAPKEFVGSCAVSYRNDRNGRNYEAVLPSFEIASRVALYAHDVTLGGFDDVEINPAFGKSVTHIDFIDWMTD
jgi:hypothetical protein